VAKAASRAGATRTGIVKGKTAYMAPEQVRALPLDRRCDVWSAGVIAWELFAGRRMHDSGTDPAALLLRIATEPAPRLASVRPDVPPAVDEAVAWALAHRREVRCPTAEHFRERLLGAWADHGGPAPTKDVADHVQLVAGSTLAARRKSATGERQRPLSTGAEHGYVDQVSTIEEVRHVDASGRADSVTSGTEASLVSSSGQKTVGRRRWVLAVEAAIVAGALGVLVFGATKRMAPAPQIADSPSTLPAATPPPPEAATHDPRLAPSAAPLTEDPAASSVALDLSTTSTGATSANASPPSAREAGAHRSAVPKFPKTPVKRAQVQEAGVAEPPLAKSPYE
jgi:serine/threonine-protein kinase